MLTPHVITYMNDFVSTQNAYAAEVEYDPAGKVTSVTSLAWDATVVNRVAREDLHPYQADAFQSFVDSFDHEPDGGTLAYMPGDHRGE